MYKKCENSSPKYLNKNAQTTCNFKKRKYSEISNDQEQLIKKQTSSQEASIICSICMEQVQEKQGKIDCGHVYCQECIQQWADIENTCPSCRKQFTNIRVKTVPDDKQHKQLKFDATLQLQQLILTAEQDQEQSSWEAPEDILSDEVEVIQVETKKQRVNENYIDPQNNILDEDYDSEEIEHDEESTQSTSLPSLDQLIFETIKILVNNDLSRTILTLNDVIVVSESRTQIIAEIAGNRFLILRNEINAILIMLCKTSPVFLIEHFPFVSLENINGQQPIYLHVIDPEIQSLFRIPFLHNI